MGQEYFDHTGDESEMTGKSEVRQKDRKADKSADKNGGRGLFIAGMISGLAITLLIVGIFYIGFTVQSLVNGTGRAVLKEDAVANSEMINKLNALEKVIDEHYYLEEVPDEKLRDGVYKGMMDALGDPYSEYYTAEELDAMMEQSQGIYYGIGAYVSLDTVTSLPKISGIIDNSPAQDSDLRPDDLVYEIDGTPTFGLSLNEAVALIKGPEYTDVVLTIIREGESDYLEITLTRRKVETPTVKFSMNGDAAYIQVTEFDEVTVDQFAEALAMAKGSDAKGIVLDLRGNPGGNLSAVVEMCRMILPEGMIVYTEDKKGKRNEYLCDGKRELDLPLVVLVDGNSASAAEIMSGAIKDYGIGTLVGTTTFGKGIVQQIMPFKDGSAVKVTISAYYTPNGNNIHGIGIEPDIECKFDSEAYYGSDEHPDNQLEKALEVLKGMYK